MIHLMTEARKVREHSSESATVLPCKCAHTNGDAQRWLQMCDAHFREWERMHAESRHG